MNRETFATVYASGGFRKTIATVRAYGVPADHAEEIAQRVWCRAWQRRNQLRDEARLLPWVLKSVRNDFLDDLRRRRPSPLPPDAPEPVIAPNINLAAIDLHLALARCRQAKLLWRVYIQQEDFESVAADLGITVDALHHRLSRARKALRKAIKTGSQSDKNVSLLDVHNYEERKRTAREAGDEKAPRRMSPQ
jgi:RNA polymerase sigma factor (sigma-70 family)